MKNLTLTDKLFLALVATPVLAVVIYFTYKCLTDFHHIAHIA